MNTFQITDNQSIILYFSSRRCEVCKFLKPKVRELIREKFPKMDLRFIEVDTHKQIAADFQVFAVPVILVYFEGKEFYKKVRNISVFELEKEISRPYQLLFEM